MGNEPIEYLVSGKDIRCVKLGMEYIPITVVNKH